VLVLTGHPGSGKTTVMMKVVEDLKAQGYTVGGMLSKEVREGNARVGFEILDLSSGRRGWLSHIRQKKGPRVGRYHVNVEDLENIGSKAILAAVKSTDVVSIDEIGPMELFSDAFRESVHQVLASKKLVLTVVHLKDHDPLVLEVKDRKDAEVFIVTEENRGHLPMWLLQKLFIFWNAVFRSKRF
jgi:nucleoside-triphosphatase